MEPLCDKLTRQKPVRLFFAAIRAGDRQSHQPVPWRLRRFLISTLCSLIFPVVVGRALIILTQDWDKSSLFGNIAFTFFLIAEWPLALCSRFYPSGDPPLLLGLSLYVLAALFWAGVIDLFMVWRKRRAR